MKASFIFLNLSINHLAIFYLEQWTQKNFKMYCTKNNKNYSPLYYSNSKTIF